MTVPIESPDIRSVYLMEMTGQRCDRQLPLSPQIKKIRRKLFENLKARRILIEGRHIKAGEPFTS